MSMDPETARAFGRLEQGVSDIKELFANHMKDDKEQFATLHKSVEKQSGKMKYAAGAVAVIVFFVSNFGWNVAQSVLGLK